MGQVNSVAPKGVNIPKPAASPANGTTVRQPAQEEYVEPTIPGDSMYVEETVVTANEWQKRLF